MAFIGFAAGVALLTWANTTSCTAGNQARPEASAWLGPDVPAPVQRILFQACRNCHSERTEWPWYSHIPPTSWLIHDDVRKARAFMNLSHWSKFSQGERWAVRTAIGTAIRHGIMPPARYKWIHPEARLSGEQTSLLEAWALGQTQRSPEH
jgi:hypothetical protein